MNVRRWRNTSLRTYRPAKPISNKFTEWELRARHSFVLHSVMGAPDGIVTITHLRAGAGPITCWLRHWPRERRWSFDVHVNLKARKRTS